MFTFYYLAQSPQIERQSKGLFEIGEAWFRTSIQDLLNITINLKSESSVIIILHKIL